MPLAASSSPRLALASPVPRHIRHSCLQVGAACPCEEQVRGADSDPDADLRRGGQAADRVRPRSPSGSPASRAAVQKQRSARRETVRSTCSSPATRQPPGSTNVRSGGSMASEASIHRSISRMAGSMRARQALPPSVARSAPTSNSSSWIDFNCWSNCGSSRSLRSRPRNELSSSTVP